MVTTLLHHKVHKRLPIRGIKSYEVFENAADIEPCDVLIAEPTFKDFRLAENTTLSLIFQTLLNVGPKARVFAPLFYYSRDNAMTFKGYLKDLVEFSKQFYSQHKTVHIPFEVCGCPMVGSTLLFLFSNDPAQFSIEKQMVFPSQMFEGMVAHSSRGRPRGGVHTGMSNLVGYLPSHRVMLPALPFWEDKILMAEYRNNDTLELSRIKPEHVNRLFGAEVEFFNETYHLCTPAKVLEAVAKGISTTVPLKA